MQDLQSKTFQNLRQKAIKGIFWSAAQTWGARAISFSVMLVLARLIAPQAFGLVAYATVFTALAQIFVDQGFSDAIVQLHCLEREHLDTSFWASLLTGALLTVMTIAASGSIANLFREPQLAPILRWLSPIFVLNALSSVQQSILRRNLDFKSLTLRSLVANLTSSAVAIIMAIWGYGVWSLVAKIVIGGIVNVCVLWQVSTWKPGLHFSIKHFRILFSFGINIVGGNFVDFFSLHSDDFLIGYFLGPIALGYYTLAYNLLIAMTDLLVSVPIAVAYPVFSRIQSDLTRTKQAFCEVSQLQSFVAFPVFLGMVAVSSEIVTALYGSNWKPSIPVVQILMLIGIARSVFYFSSSLFKAAGKPSWRLGIWSLTAILNVVGFLIVVQMGIVAVAASYMLVSFMILPLYFFMIRHLIHVSMRIYLIKYIPAVLSSLMMMAAISILKTVLSQNVVLPIRLLMLVFVGGVTYFSVLRLLHPPLYKQIREFAHLAFPNFLARQS